ncbi:hypothetical protein [Winogradskyella eckloniae]|uniref:hypothetical protein n=1 Tax=Winogradskyella eckloniae TaxID=1089306 RepID=UPI001884F143|nr:hypothetical protein [Winogradskyella eckloniae]
MNRLLIITAFSLTLLGCASDSNKQAEKEIKTNSTTKKNKQISNLNISILLDLSDRIDTTKYNNPSMQFYRRDVGYLNSVAEAFEDEIKHKKSRHLDDKIQLYFDPEPLNPKINDLSNQLKFHVTRDNGTLDYINAISSTYAYFGLEIYKQALKDANHDNGSDTWGFFKNKVKDYCIDKDYRNILVILTDGYIFYEDSNLNEDNLSSYITPKKIRHKKLNSSNWKEIIESNNHGFIPVNQDLSNLEILVLGINPSTSNNNDYDYDVLKKYWSDWLYGMGLKEGNFEFKMAELPANMDIIIKNFIKNK